MEEIKAGAGWSTNVKNRSHIQNSARFYVQTAQPLDPDKGWQREDIQVAFMAGAEAPPVTRLMSLKDVADALAVSVATVNDLVRFGELAYVHSGRGAERRLLTFRPEEIESFIKRHTRRDYRDPGPSTARQSVKRKNAHELAVERAIDGQTGFLARYEALLAERKAAKQAKRKKS